MRAASLLLVAAALSVFAFVTWLMFQVGQWALALLPIALVVLLVYITVRLVMVRYWTGGPEDRKTGGKID